MQIVYLKYTGHQDTKVRTGVGTTKKKKMKNGDIEKFTDDRAKEVIRMYPEYWVYHEPFWNKWWFTFTGKILGKISNISRWF